MPLHGKVVVLTRTGGDGTEFPLTATCLFGRKPDCDIRIQLPHVSKEHCRIDLNENKEIILTNLSSVNPTRVNGEPVPQSERLKHGDVITIIDRSFRFEYPPAPTPKKRSSTGGKTETLKVLQDQQVGGTVTSETEDKKKSEVSTDPHLKDGTNHDNIQRSLEKTFEVESKEDENLLQSKTASPFNDLYQMIKKSLDVKTPRKSSASVLQTPTSRFCTPRPVSVRKNDGKPVIPTEDKIPPKKDEAKASPIADEIQEEAENVSTGTPKSVKKQRRSFQVPSNEMARPEAENTPTSEATPSQKRNRTPPQRFTASEVTEKISAQTPKSPVRRRSKEVQPAVTKEQEEPAVTRKASPRNSGKVENVNVTPKKRKSEELASDLPTQEQKRKRVSFGGFLCPELFDKRLPPDSPLRKGASPRRSLSVSKPKLSLLRRASVIGSKMEFEHGKKSPKSRSPSPKAATPAKKSPKSRSPSPKAATPAKKSPKPRTPSPKAATPAKKSPKPRTPSPKAATPAKKSPKSKSPSPTKGSAGVQTPRAQGRFSVSQINTPSPVAEDAVTAQVPLVTVTPKIPLRRKSISQKTPKSAVKVMRRSGISRASMKVKNSYADIVRFGQTKPQVAPPARIMITKKTTKKTVSKPKTPARKIQGHVSTGHADSPVTIVVGRAHKQKVVYPTGAAPRLVPNTALLKKNMKMDEDLTGIAELLKTPVNDRKRRLVINENNATKTPVSTSVVEPSVLNTPEEPGEMMVSPLSVASTIKERKYNTEAVQRLLNDDQESSFLSDTPALESLSDDSSEQQSTDLKTTSVTTPKQKPELPESLTGVKRIMKTPRQKAEPIEDLRGKILKTPKQKSEQLECLTGVKRIMKTPRQKAEPIEDLRGKILKTPKQKPEQQEFLTGVKSMMKTPRHEAKPVEAIRMELLTTPKQKSEQQECLTGVKRICKTPQQESQPLEDFQGKLVETPKGLEAVDVSFDDVKEIVEIPAHNQESEDLPEMMAMKRSPLVTPREKRLVKTPTGNAPVDDLEGNQELIEEPLTEHTGQLETNEQVGDQTLLECDEDVAKELDFAHQEPQDDVPTDVIDDVPQVDIEKEADANEVVNEHLEEVPSGHVDDDESSDTVEISQVAVDEKLFEEQPIADAVSEEQPGVDTVDEKLPEDQSTVDAVSEEQPEVDTVDEKLPEDQSTVDAVSEEQPEVDTVDEKLPEDQSTVDAVSEEQPEVDTVDEKLPEDQSTVHDVSEEQPEVDTVDEKLPEDQSTVHDVSEEQPEVDTVDEKLPEDQSTVDAVSEEQPEVDTVDEKLSEQQQPTVDAAGLNIFEEQPKVETASGKVTEMDTTAEDPDHAKKSVRGRRAKTVKPKAAAEKQEAAEHTEDPVVPAPVRGRRGMKTEATAPPAVRQTTRGRNAKSQESRDVELTVEQSVSQASKVALKPKRGRQAKQASSDPHEMVEEVAIETVPEPGSEQSPPVDVDHEANDSAAPLEKAVLKPRRGRKAKQPEQSAPEQQDVPSTHSEDVPRADMSKEADANQVCIDQLEVLPSGGDESKTMATVPQAPVSESLPEVETDTLKVSEIDAVVEKKSVRGRRARVVESKQEVAEYSEDTVVPAPVRGRRGKKTEATAPPAVRQTRGRNAKSQESPCDDQTETVPEKDVETTLVTEAVSDQTASIKETESAPAAEEAVVKPVRGRKTKQTPVEPPQPEPEESQVAIDEPLTADAQPQNAVPTLEKPRRGRKTKVDTVKENEVAEDKVVVLETKQQSQPPVRTKRGRNAKQEEEKLESTAVETTKSQEPATKMRRTRKAEQDPEESREEVPAAETIVPEKVEAPPVAEPAKLNDQASAAAKPRRGGRKAKQDTENETPAESTEVHEVPAVSSTDKVKRGRRGKQVTEEAAVTAVVPEEKPEHALEAEEKNKVEPDAPVIKPSRAKAAKTLVKNDVSQAIPAKRARRGTALAPEETNAEPSDPVSEPVSTSVEAPKRARRAAAKPTADDATASSDQANPTKDASSAVEDDAKKSVRWKADLEVIEVPKAKTIKAVRGRKTKLGGQVDTESKTVSKDANETEEKDLSDKVVEAQPVKRARRGAKVADVTTDEAETTSEVQSVEADAQPKTRRGRSAKK